MSRCPVAARKPGTHTTVQRDGTTVSLVFACPSEYAAIKLYDELIEQAGAGQIGLSFNVGPIDQ
jgi:hypothetical protein